MRDPSCVFCNIVAGEIPASKVQQGEGYLAFLDGNPLSDGHTLVIPTEHKSDIFAMDAAGCSQIASAIPKLCRAIQHATKAEGINILCNSGKAAGQVVPHVHFHLIPRFSGDGLGFRWNAGSYAPDRAQTISAAIRASLLELG